MQCTSKPLFNGVFSTMAAPLMRSATLPPSFLLPAFAATATQTSSFSTTTSRDARKDGNPRRGISALNRTGLKNLMNGPKKKQYVRMLENLPKPVLDPSLRTQIEVDENHGLWEFFGPERTSMATPAELAAHGGPWHIQHLRRKDWDDLHRLWWVCLKELNRINTYQAERDRIGDMYGEFESSERKTVIKKTMKAIKATLTERWYAWDNARFAAMEDNEINMYANLDVGEKAYLPANDVEEQPASTGDENTMQYHPGNLASATTEQPRV